MFKITLNIQMIRNKEYPRYKVSEVKLFNCWIPSDKYLAPSSLI